MEKITGPQLLRNSNLNTNIKFIKYKQNIKHNAHQYYPPPNITKKEISPNDKLKM